MSGQLGHMMSPTTRPQQAKVTLPHCGVLPHVYSSTLATVNATRARLTSSVCLLRPTVDLRGDPCVGCGGGSEPLPVPGGRGLRPARALLQRTAGLAGVTSEVAGEVVRQRRDAHSQTDPAALLHGREYPTSGSC